MNNQFPIQQSPYGLPPRKRNDGHEGGHFRLNMEPLILFFGFMSPHFTVAIAVHPIVVLVN